MKKPAIVFFLLTFLTSMLQAQDKRFSGTWQGVVNVGIDLRVVFHIKPDAKGILSATSDSPDQSVFGIACDSVIVTGNDIRIEIKALLATYTGTLVNDTTIKGKLTQGVSLPLDLVKSDKIVTRNRPQTPTPPFPYKSEDVLYYSPDSSLQYGATITIPQGKGPFPAMVLITGSGAQNRDEEILGHRTFAVLADHLTRKGYIVLRVDDRGVGETTGSLNATSEDFAGDVSLGVDYLLSRTEVDKNKIGLVGHSEGGMIAPMVANKRKDINFIILLAAPGVKVIELMAEQNYALAKSNNMSEQALKQIRYLFTNVVNAIINSADSTEAMKQTSAITDRWATTQPMEVLKEMDFETKEKRDNYAGEMVNAFQSAWFRYFIKFDPTVYLTNLTARVLALNGDRDIQVISSQNLPGIEAALKKGKNKNYTIKEIPQVNHLFQTCKKCTVMEYAELEETFSPLALKIISDWLDKEVK
jgi:pimeloyl-ACP methyl ester carboxylesterase